MRITRRLGMLLLATWLILEVLSRLFKVNFSGTSIIMGILALAGGILLYWNVDLGKFLATNWLGGKSGVTILQRIKRIGFVLPAGEHDCLGHLGTAHRTRLIFVVSWR